MSSATDPQKAAVIISIWSTAVESVQWEILVQFMGGISQSKCSAVCSVFYYLFITVRIIDLSQSGFTVCSISISKFGWLFQRFSFIMNKNELGSIYPTLSPQSFRCCFCKRCNKILFPCRICPCSLKLSSIALSIFLTRPPLKYQSSPPPPTFV